MTREEHLKWCKERAIAEMDFTGQPLQGLVSMASDLRKHPETNHKAMIDLCMGQMLVNPHMTRQDVIKFINGFN